MADNNHMNKLLSENGVTKMKLYRNPIIIVTDYKTEYKVTHREYPVKYYYYTNV